MNNNRGECILNIGFDDTDSPKGMCTTYLAYKITHIIKKHKAQFLDYPRLIRFNPNIPWKTRGNGAVSMRIKTKNPKTIKEKITQMIKLYSDTKNGANPGLVFYESSEIPLEFKNFSKQALWQLIHRNSAKKFARKNNLETFHLGNGQGLIGAIGAIGYEFNDSTVELLCYRKKQMFGKTRNISTQSVKKMQENTYPDTFNSYDPKKRKILLAPHGPDPVFYGLRGETPAALYNASKSIKFNEKLDGHMVFRSNQGTGDHLKNKIDLNILAPYTSGTVQGTICTSPTIHIGGYVMFSLYSDNIKVNCAVYKPTGLTCTALELIIGDEIMIGGGVRKSTRKHPRVINVEFINVLKLANKVILSNPPCKKCGKNMKSKGKSQGFSCSNCKTHTKNKISKKIPRNIKKQQYTPIVSAHRHLTRPIQRMGKSNKQIIFDESIPWFVIY